MRPFTSLFCSAVKLFKYSAPVLFVGSANRYGSHAMPPIPESVRDWTHKTIDSAAVIIFSKSRCPFCHRVKEIFKENNIKHATIELDQREDGSKIIEALSLKSGIRTVPQVFVRGAFIGDSNRISKLKEEGKLRDVVKQSPYDYDLVVIGGGSGGLAASKLTKKDGTTSTITTNKIILANGERPRYPGIPGDREYAITSDDLFSLSYNPGKTLVVGASYVSLECAGFLTSFGNDTTVMVRSILLRGFDQQMAEFIGEYMKNHGTKFIRSCVPTEIRQLKPVDKANGKPGRYLVTGQYTDGRTYSDEFDTIIFAIGRDPCIDKDMMENLGVKLDKANRVICADDEQTSVPNIYAVGDINSGKPQLTPVAIQAGRYLARRLFAGFTELTNYKNVPTTVFTPIEYGCIGYSEEDAIATFGKDNIVVYHSHFNPLEWSLPHRDDNVCYAKLVCNKSKNEQVVGFHVVGPNAGEMTQGYAVALQIGATKADFDRTIGIHPTCTETFTTLRITKDSGETFKVTGC
ncbi:unnamed protein product [Dicrocoelium dendriticum]|nr:unnamed protein product [Dicrocoelium dendriticum]